MTSIIGRPYPPVTLARVLLAVVTAGAVSCTDSTGVDGDDQGPPALLVSDPVTASAPDGRAALQAAAVTYVSFPPGTIPGAVSATISNRRTEVALRVALVGGGLDPIAIVADAADTLAFVIDTGGSEPMRFTRLVPVSMALAIVRTEPPGGARDVPMNLRAGIIFSEPVDPATVTGTTIGITQGGTAVPGTVTVSDDGLKARFEPDADLRPDTDYILKIRQGLRDAGGSPLQSAVDAPFTTGTASGVPVALRFDRQPVSALVGAINPSPVLVGAVDAQGNPATGFTGTVSLALGANPGGGALQGVTTRTGGPQVEFDGLRIASAGSGYTLVATSDGLTSATSAPFDVLADDGLIAFTSVDAGIVVVRAGGGAYSVLVPDVTIGFLTSLAWAPDGSRLALSRHGTIHVVNADGSGLASLGQEGYAPTWSPDGSMIAFVGDRDGDHDIFRMRADGSELVRLTDSPQVEDWPDWSPDGKSIVFTRRARTWLAHEAEILAMNPDGSGVRSLGRQGMEPAWSPDGTRIAFTGIGAISMDIYVMNADGSDVTSLTGGHGDVASVSPTWSPDGRRIAYSRSVNDENVPYSLWVMNADGTGVRLVHPASLDITVNPLRAALEPSWRPEP